MCPMFRGPHRQLQALTSFPKCSKKQDSSILLQPKFRRQISFHPKSDAEATRKQDFSTDNFSVLLSNFITNLNSLISPLITLHSSVLHT
ncbi:Nucleic-acid-binding protein from transposon X-element [Aphis craccivora]|uniref:Nucleic-acid-binding protein from transposon X-element n=1 Tax=Aphis craccivora TaxID=307492 RepID=A0A6G0Z6U6_APHCR|nr:Nucleic-acid-binding protein from transposon X-element [Aphis craccivora]